MRPRAKLPVEYFADIKASLDGSYLIKGLIPTDSNVVTFGYPGSGKTFVTTDMALSIAAGLEWHGHKVRQGGVVYIAAEGQAGFRRRIDAWRQEHDITGDIQFASIPVAVDMLNPSDELNALTETIADIANRWGGLAAIAVDTLSATFGGGDENGPDMAAYVGNVARLAAPYRATRAIVHHQPLNGDAKRPRGHGSLWGSADVALHVIGDREAPARRVHVLKQKDSDPGPDILFRLKQVELGTDQDGDPVTSCIVEPVELEVAAATARGRKLTPKEKIVLDQLNRMLVESGQFPPSDIPDSVLNRARTVKVVRVSEWRPAALSALQSPDVQPDTVRSSFERVRNSLQASKNIGVWEEWAWLG